jgi:hypothetical protein
MHWKQTLVKRLTLSGHSSVFLYCYRRNKKKGHSHKRKLPARVLGSFVHCFGELRDLFDQVHLESVP